MGYLLDPVSSNQKTREKFARAIVEATTHYEDYELIASLSKGLGNAMKGVEISTLLRTTHARAWMVIKGEL